MVPLARTAIGIQVVVISVYVYGVLAWLRDDAGSFPEQAPPGWAWPAVIATLFGPLLLGLSLLVTAPLLRLDDLRTRPELRQWLRVGTIAAAIVLLIMVTPPGWEIFDWYVG